MVSTPSKAGEQSRIRSWFGAADPAIGLGALRRFYGGIAARILVSMALVGLPVTVIAGWLVYSASNADRLNYATTNLVTNVATAVDRFNEEVSTSRSDTLFLSHLPSIDGVIRAHEIGNAELEATWKERLVVVFSDLMATRPDFFQVRFIGVEDGGREVVRVERLGDGSIVALPDADLQPKGDRSYYIAAASLPDGGVHISEIDLNREFGEIEIPHRPTYRVASPVYDADGVFRGIVVVNVNSNEAFVNAASTVISEADLYIANQDGDLLYGPDESRTFGFDLGQRYLIQEEIAELASLYAEDADSTTAKVTVDGVSYLLAAQRSYFDPDRPDRFIVIASLLPLSAVTFDAGNLYGTIAVIVVVLLFAGLTQLMFLMQTVVRPLRSVRDAAQEIGAGNRDIDLAEVTTRSDELGDVARAFDVMASRIKEREEELVEKADALAQSNQELSQFAYVASHDLQEPLRMVASYLELLSSRYRGKLDEEADEFIGFAVDGAERMKRLINDLLAYSRSNNRALSVAPVDAKEILDRVIETYSARIDETDAEIVVGPMPEIDVDSAQIERLFANLIDNAMKYRTDAPPKVTVTAERKGRFWEFVVADNGIGIDGKFHDKVFEIFARLHGRDRYPGTGIGLASCRRVVERHGGRIWIESVPTGGSAFHFTLPATRFRRAA